MVSVENEESRSQQKARDQERHPIPGPFFPLHFIQLFPCFPSQSKPFLKKTDSIHHHFIIGKGFKASTFNCITVNSPSRL